MKPKFNPIPVEEILSTTEITYVLYNWFIKDTNNMCRLRKPIMKIKQIIKILNIET